VRIKREFQQSAGNNYLNLIYHSKKNYLYLVKNYLFDKKKENEYDKS